MWVSSLLSLGLLSSLRFSYYSHHTCSTCLIVFCSKLALLLFSLSIHTENKVEYLQSIKEANNIHTFKKYMHKNLSNSSLTFEILIAIS